MRRQRRFLVQVTKDQFDTLPKGPGLLGAPPRWTAGTQWDEVHAECAPLAAERYAEGCELGWPLHVLVLDDVGGPPRRFIVEMRMESREEDTTT